MQHRSGAPPACLSACEPRAAVDAAKLKIDKSFIQRIDSDHATEAIIALGRNLDLEVVAEGIEPETALRSLQDHGCDRPGLLVQPAE